jgi:hypothetical protein
VKRICVCCEGQKTEPAYLRGLRRHLRNNLIEIDVVPGPGVPATVVARAVEKQRDSARARKRHPDEVYDEVWAVFDRDEHPGYAGAIETARVSGVHAANSNPCFELWLLLHFQDQTAALERDDACARLKLHVPTYEKRFETDDGKGFEAFSGNLDAACARAETIRRRASENQTDGNPTTNMDLLLRSVRGDDR